MGAAFNPYGIYPQNTTAVKIVDHTVKTSYKDGKMYSIRWKSDGVCFLWNTRGIPLIDYLEKTITGEAN